MTASRKDQIARQLSKGVPEGEIREDLRREGLSEEEIRELFPVHQYDMRSWYLFFGICVSLAGIYFLLKNGSYLLLVLGALLLGAYVREVKRLKG